MTPARPLTNELVGIFVPNHPNLFMVNGAKGPFTNQPPGKKDHA